MRVFALLILAFLFLPLAQAQAACGKFVVVKGDVQVDFAKEKRTDKARVGTEVCAGDSIKAGVDSRAKVVMVDNNELNISPDTVMKIATYEYKPQENQKKVLLDVLKGKVRSTVKQKYDGQANTFQVKTKAAVAGVRGTDFITSFDPKVGRLEVITFEGRVEVGNMGSDGRVIPNVTVTAGQTTGVMMGKTPEPPRAMPASDLKRMDNETQAAMPPPKGSDQVRNTQAPRDEETKKEIVHERQPASAPLMPPEMPGDAGAPGGPGPGPGPGTVMPNWQPPMPGTNVNMNPDFMKQLPKGLSNVNVIITDH